MAMWPRIKRVFRSFVGWFVEIGENPELILKQNIRDLEDQIPTLNENIALIKANETLHRKEVEKLSREEQDLTAKIKASLKQGNRDLALNFATTLDQVRQSKRDAEQQLAMTTASYERALKVKKAYMQEKERKVMEARTALNAKKRAEWQAKVADAMASFTPTGVDATHDEMIRKIEEDAAHSEAKLEVALEGAEFNNLDMSEEAKRLQANDTLRQFELEMGLVEEAAPPVRDQADISEAPTATPTEKTIGPRERELA